MAKMIAPRKDKTKQQDRWEFLKPCKYNIVVASNTCICIVSVYNMIKKVILKIKGPLICMERCDNRNSVT